MKTVYVNKNLADPLKCGNLRGVLTVFYDSNNYKTIEEDAIQNHSVYVIDSKQFADVENYLSKSILEEFKSFDDNHIYVMNDFSTDVESLAKTSKHLNDLGFNVKNLWIQVTFNYEKEELDRLLNSLGLTTVNIFCYNLYLDMTYHRYNSSKKIIDLTKSQPGRNPKKFTMFVRRFDNDRFELYCDLIENNLLSNFEYTFTNLHPEQVEYPHIYVTKDVLKTTIPPFVTNRNNIRNWIDGLPYHMGDLDDPFTDNLYPMYMKGQVNIIVETRSTNVDRHNLYITEKTYKPIIMCKPFLVFGPSGCLEILKREGFKTFHPHIDESYDQATDLTHLKRKAIIKEVKRLSMLSDTEFFNTMSSKEIQEITSFNFNHFLKTAQNNYITSKAIYSDLFGITI